MHMVLRSIALNVEVEFRFDTTFTDFMSYFITLIMFNPISSLLVATNKANNWFKTVGRNVIKVVS